MRIFVRGLKQQVLTAARQFPAVVLWGLRVRTVRETSQRLQGENEL